ncbi:multidrug effflux MFS transporter [Xanthomonas sp. XNM01]|mgnify:CR=1 FL=1|uniref:multidrug effflux MFS transporter n=1 Tax=Xanthomonas sp. XNM01 TaxID=2769289 RepID=UPI00177C88CE|nr:multidrug effflux MFS transporter [Xanthomonas sp. XNM01]MBD9368644.1 multidrug effflux MFS transporter [Xanthomonas sp. XNM01]
MGAPVSTRAAISTRRLALLLGGLAMFGPFSIDTIFPAFPQMAGQFAADKVAMQQTISVYLLAYALMSIVHGPLSDAIGRRKVILAGLVVFILASVGCALATDLPTLLAMRAVQGLSAGVGLIVGRAVIRDVLQGSDAQRLMSQVSMIFGIAPAIAPIIGGWMLGLGRWPLIFWFLAGFSLLLLAATWRWLPETHPVDVRMPFKVKRLARDYVAIGTNPRFLRLAAAGALGFAGLFLYIASAPAFVMELLGLGEREFAWLFIPTIGGMTIGAFVSGRVAGRWAPARQVGVGYACMGVAALCNVAYTGLAPTLSVPWAVLPMSLAAFGVALVFPVLTLAILDMYPRQRGSSSSLQAFLQLVLNSAIAGLLSPLLSHHGLHLALAMLGFVLAGWLVWRWEARLARRFPPPPSSPTLEPGEQL